MNCLLLIAWAMIVIFDCMGFINFARSQNIAVGPGRGSAAGVL